MPLSFVPLPHPKDVWISGNLCGTQDGQKSLLLWKVSCGDPLYFSACVRKPPNNNDVNKTEVPALMSLLQGLEEGDDQRRPRTGLGPEHASITWDL